MSRGYYCGLKPSSTRLSRDTMVTISKPVLSKEAHSLEKVQKFYENIEDLFEIKKTPFFKDLVCPKNWEEHRFDRWFKLKEGYSSFMVEHLLKEFKASPDEWVLDPFLGSGSTLVGARNAGINGVGFEINPFLATLSRAKLHVPRETEELEKAVSNIFKELRLKKPIEIPVPKLRITKKLFRDQLDTLLRIKQEILRVENDIVQTFLLVGLGCVAQRASFAKKDGNGLKYPKNKIPEKLEKILKEQYKIMLGDIKNIHGNSTNNGDFLVFHGDSRAIHVNKNPFFKNHDKIENMLDNTNYCIFSPPYANCFDYTEVYKIELWMLDFVKKYPDLKVLRKKSLSSHLNKKYDKSVESEIPELDYVIDMIPWEDTWGKEKMRAMVVSYFNDMEKIFEKMSEILGDHGTLVCVVGNSAYGNLPIATDLFLSMMLKELDFNDVEIRVARQLGTSSQQMKYLKDNPYLRESLIVAKK